MADKIELEIVTPKGRALAVSADEVTAPSVEGEFGVLPGHLPMVASLRTGIVTYRVGSDTKKCAVGTGFAEAGHNKVLILADEYTERQGIDPVIVRKELAEVQAKLEKLIASMETTPGLESERKHLIDHENWLAAQLELYGDPPAATMRPFEEWGPPPRANVEEEDAKRSSGDES
ncbi:MAG: ATP synthase F1 subunit epsilon [Labilithrix sp.]|nr:ATP synthase F1 subunit epsilon [Labilithrix sp.]